MAIVKKLYFLQDLHLSGQKMIRGFSGVHKFFVKPELRLNPSPVNIKFF